jgi:hypothetical protein
MIRGLDSDCDPSPISLTADTLNLYETPVCTRVLIVKVWFTTVNGVHATKFVDVE